MKKVMNVLYHVMAIALIAWFLLSWLEIGFHNDVPNYTYRTWNLLRLFWGMV